MTNSTTKPEKKKGPFRTGALLAVAVVMAVSMVFAKFFLDRTIEKTIEWSASYIHGADVDLASVETKLLSGQLYFNGLTIADKKKLTHNLVAIDSIRFDLVMDALLRAKIVIADASIEGVVLDQKRKRPARLYQQTTQEKRQSEERKQLVKEKGQKVASIAAEELEENVLGNLASIAAGDKAKDQATQIRESLASEKKIKELEQTLEQKENEWKDKIKAFKHQDDLKRLSREIKNVKVDKKKPWKAAKQYVNLSKEVKAKIKQYKTDAKNLKSDISYFEKSIKEVKQMAKDDLNQLGDRFSLNGVDSKDLASVIFRQLLQDSTGEYYKYILLARDYLPNKKGKSSDEGTIVPRKRGEGKYYHFPTSTSYPFFWWQKGDFSVQNADANFSGSVRDFSSAPYHLNKVATLKVAGDLPQKKIKAFSLDGSFDHRGEVNDDKLELSIRGYPVTNRRFLKNKKLSFGLERAISNWRTQARMTGDQLSFDIKGLFSDAKYSVSSSSSTLQEVFSGAVSSMPTVSFQAKGLGTWGDLDWRIRSDFADQLTRQLKVQLKAKVARTKQKYREKLEKKLGTEKLEQKYQKLKSQFDDILAKEKGKLDSLAKNALKDASKKSKPDTKKLEKKAKELFKKFKF